MHPTHQPDHGVTLTPADTLRHTAQYLNRYGWHQGDLFDRTGNLPFPPACLTAAIHMTVCGSADVDLRCNADIYQWTEIHHAIRVLAGYLHTEQGLDDTLIWENASADEETVADWNDEPTTTLPDVTTALYAAADEWDLLHTVITARDTACGDAQ
jgi:hypothetical protein